MRRLTAATISYSFLTTRTFTTGYAYDAASNRTGFTDPEESGSTTYAYDTLNRLMISPVGEGHWSILRWEENVPSVARR
jgi:hypothetical protein